MRFALLLLALALPLAAQHTDRNPFSSQADLEEGKKLYRLSCGVCHGMEGKSGRGARLAVKDHRHGNADAELFRVIQNGVPGTDMPGLWMDEDDIWRILLFVRTFEVNAGEACSVTPGDAARGGSLYQERGCATCHMVGGNGGRLGPDLTHIGLNYSREQLRESLIEPDKQVGMKYRTVIVAKSGSTTEGVLLNEDSYTVNLMDRGERLRRLEKDGAKVEKPAKSLMPAYTNLSEQQMDDMLAYMCRPARQGERTMKRILALGLLAAAVAFPQVTSEDLLRDQETPADWLTYHGGNAGWRHSGLKQIKPQNAADLRMKWVFQRRINTHFETTPLVHDGVMYLTVPPNEAFAIDAETGRGLWHYVRELPPKIIACCGEVNRGLAIHGDKLFMATLDAHVIALDRKTGRELWDSEMIDYTQGYSGTHAPIVVKDMVIVGTAGAEYGIRGFVDAFDIETGERKWRFYTVPGEGEPGNETWGGDSWKSGGGSVWVTPSYDPELDLICTGASAIPAPTGTATSVRATTCTPDSVVALEAGHGRAECGTSSSRPTTPTTGTPCR